MPAPTMPLIVEYLDERPRGASLEEIAAFLDTTCDSARTSMKRLLERGQVKFEDSVWKTNRERTPPVFKALETLKAMQESVIGQRARMLRKIQGGGQRRQAT
jgi:predicted ArsR family transcriptional regulator